MIFVITNWLLQIIKYIFNNWLLQIIKYIFNIKKFKYC